MSEQSIPEQIPQPEPSPKSESQPILEASVQVANNSAEKLQRVVGAAVSGAVALAAAGGAVALGIVTSEYIKYFDVVKDMAQAVFSNSGILAGSSEASRLLAIGVQAFIGTPLFAAASFLAGREAYKFARGTSKLIQK